MINALIPHDVPLILIDILLKILLRGLCPPPHFAPQMALRAIELASPLNYITRKCIAKVNGYGPLCYQPLYFGNLSSIKCASVAS